MSDELQFSPEESALVDSFAAGIALGSLAAFFAKETRETPNLSVLDIYMRKAMKNSLEEAGETLDPNESETIAYFQFLCTAFSNETGIDYYAVISAFYGAAATHFSKSSVPVVCGVVPKDLTIPEEWLKEN